MWGIAFADVVIGWLRRLVPWLIGAGLLLGAAAALYFWAYDRGRDAERVKWQTASEKLTAAAYDLMDAIDKRLELDAAQLAEARRRVSAAQGRSKAERDAYYADPANPNPLCFTPARVVRREQGLVELAAGAGGADRDRDALPARPVDAEQGKGRQPAGERGGSDD